jgi:hypothetical protein
MANKYTSGGPPFKQASLLLVRSRFYLSLTVSFPPGADCSFRATDATKAPKLKVLLADEEKFFTYASIPYFRNKNQFGSNTAVRMSIDTSAR